MANETCDPAVSSCTLTGIWPKLSWDGSGNVTNSGEAAVRFQVVSSTQSKIIYPTGRTLTYTKDANDRVTTVTDGKGVWTYSYPAPGQTSIVNNEMPTIPSMATWSPTTGLLASRGAFGVIPVTYAYDTKQRVVEIGGGEGPPKTKFVYDARGNITEVRRISSTPGTPADLVTTASYPDPCVSIKTCNKPQYTIDALGKRTDYTYDPVHGGVTSVTYPAASASAVRPQVRYGYTAVSANYRNGSGTIIAGDPMYRVTSISRCATSASCAGQAGEVKTTITYDPNSATLPASRTIGSGDGVLAATTSYSYYPTGNVKTIDGPLSGTEDTTRLYYDARRRNTGTIGPDPDGSGTRPRPARKVSYNAEGQPTSIEIGTASSQADNGMTTFVSLQRATTLYDAQGRVARQSRIVAGSPVSVADYSYTNVGMVQCVATRMNPATFGALPTSACTPAATGSQGADRITKSTYNYRNQLETVTTAVGTPQAAVVLTNTYSSALRTSVKDGENNKTTYLYDELNRPTKTQYPSPAAGSGTSSTTDYDELVYGVAGGVVQRRLRDGTSIAYTYDWRNRLTGKDIAGGTSLDVTYTYDLLGRPLTIGTSNQMLSFTYDALSRVLTQVGPLGTVSAEYDVAGRRTRLAWPDGFFVAYDYDTLGNMLKIRENGVLTGAGVLATFTYDSLGNRATVARGNGTTTNYTYDNISRLATLEQNLSGATNDLTLSFGYNVADQVTSNSRSNDLYAWGGHSNHNIATTVNGLNQATLSGGAGIGYDANGNTTSIGASNYSYLPENLLQTAPGANTLYYDPLNRLYQINQTTRFGYDGLGLIGEWSTSATLLKRYVHGPGSDEPLVWYEGSGTSDRRWLHADERRSIVAISNGTGASISTNSYDEYGVPGSGNAGRFQYTGQTWLPELGMYYYKARVYAPTLGRFMQPDPIGYRDGMGLYNYVGSDPVNFADPLGLQSASGGGPDIVVVGYNNDIVVTGPSYCERNGCTPGVSGVADNPNAQFRNAPGRMGVKGPPVGPPQSDPLTGPRIICQGRARVFDGNETHVGTQGGFPGVPVGANSAAIIPRQFTNSPYAGPAMRSLGSTAWGYTFNPRTGAVGQSFYGFTETVGNDRLPGGSLAQQEHIMAANPGNLVLELVSGYDEGTTGVYLDLPSTAYGCPEGTSQTGSY